MNEEEKQAIEYLKHSIFEYEEIDTSVMEYMDKNHKIIYKLILKQQKEIKARSEEIDSLYKMMSAKDDEIEYLADKIEQMKEDYQMLKDDIEGHNITYVDTPEFEENYISKDKIRKKLDLIDKEYAEIIEKNKNDLYIININAQRHSAMQIILEELLGE